MPSANAAENVFDYNPNAKIIVCLRNPITRAYSHYMALKYGKEQRIFMDAVKAGIRVKSKVGMEEGYLELGLYAPQLKRWLKHYDAKQFYMVWQEQMFEDPNQVLEEIRNFLGLNSMFNTLNNTVHGSEVPKSKIVSKIIGGIGPKVASSLPNIVKQKVKKIVLSKP